MVVFLTAGHKYM